MPCDMDDDVVEDVIQFVTKKLSQYDNEEWEQKGLEVILQDISQQNKISSCILGM